MPILCGNVKSGGLDGATAQNSPGNTRHWEDGGRAQRHGYMDSKDFASLFGGVAESHNRMHEEQCERRPRRVNGFLQVASP